MNCRDSVVSRKSPVPLAKRQTTVTTRDRLFSIQDKGEKKLKDKKSALTMENSSCCHSWGVYVSLPWRPSHLRILVSLIAVFFVSLFV